MYIWVALKESARSAKILWIITEVCSNQGFLQVLRKNYQLKPSRNLMPERCLHGPKKCVERHCELANKTTQQLYKVATPGMDDHQLTEEENEPVGELSTVCSQIVLKCQYLARSGRPDILRSVNKLARAITKWTKSSDKRLARLISYIHHTSEHRQYCDVGNTAQQCRQGLFQDSDFALKTKSQHQEEFCAFSEVTRLCQ